MATHRLPKGDGDAPVQAYVEAMPGWKRDVGSILDCLIVATVPKVRKAVRWNAPFYGIDGEGWFLSFHCLAKYIKVTFLNGVSLNPRPLSIPSTLLYVAFTSMGRNSSGSVGVAGIGFAIPVETVMTVAGQLSS